jgi:small neutral amino acid transporter SnatA (MarC family)
VPARAHLDLIVRAMPQIQLDATLFASNVPIFLSLTRGQTLVQQRRAALLASLVAGAVILAFALFGQQVLTLLGISLESLQVAGGLLLLVIALELLRPGGGLTLRFATLLGRVLHIDLLSRIMGLLVAVLAVQLVASAVESWVRTGVS